ncbi:MAG: MFS transporter [Pseudomonadota bacterium]
MAEKTSPENETGSLWAPLAQPLFASLWLAMLVSATGGWMHETAAGWLMTSLTPSPAIVALVQTANTFPIFLFALLAGALADRADKRRFLIIVNTGLALLVFLFALLVAADRVTPLTLVIFTFLIGSGATFSAPAWQALMPELVERERLRSAIALNSLGINISRAIGPAVAGFMIAGISMAAPFMVNAATYLVVVAVLLLWRRRPAPRRPGPPEPILTAIGTGLRHAIHNDPLKETIMRAAAFFVPASALWALIPVIARALPDSGASVFGAMTASVGAGAVAGALVLPKLRERWDSNALALASSGLMALTLPLLGMAQGRIAVLCCCFLAGTAWIASLTSFNFSAQTALPAWVRARGLSIFMMAFFGSMTVGSLCWGQVAQWFGVGEAMTAAGLLLALLALVTRNIRLGAAEGLDLTPSMHWPAPAMVLGPEDADGPVMISIEYRVPPENTAAFRSLMRELRGERFRDGAYEWGLHRASDEATLWLEWFLVSSWEEHLRQHERVSEADRQLQERISALLADEASRHVRHWLADV